MSNSPSGVYRTLITASTELPHALQEQIFTYAKSNKDFELLATLALCPSLSSTLDEKLGSIPSAKVQSAYVARPGRTPAQLSAKARKDHRVVVCELLAELPNLELSAYEALSKNKSDRVLLALAKNQAAPTQIRESALAVLACNTASLASQALHEYSVLATGEYHLMGPALQAILAKTKEEAKSRRLVSLSSSSPQLRALQIFMSDNVVGLDDLPPTAATSLLELLLISFDSAVKQHNAVTPTTPQTSVSYNYERRRVYTAFAHVVNQVFVALDSPVATAEFRARAADIALELKGALQKETTSLVEKLLTRLTEPAPITPRNSASVIAALTDPEELLAVANAIDKNTMNYKAPVLALLSNPNSDLRVVTAVFSKRLSTIDGKRAFLARIDDTLVAAEIAASSVMTVTDELLAKAADPEALMEALFERRPEKFVSQLDDSHFLTRSLARKVPVEFLSGVSRNSFSTTSPLASLVSKEITSALGESPRAWALFEDLVTSSPGTLGSLLDKVSSFERVLATHE